MMLTMLLPILSVIAFVLLIDNVTSAKIQVYNVTTSNLTRLTNDSFYPANVLKAHNQLIYVSYPRVNSDTTIKLSWHDERRSCEIFLPPRVDYHTTKAQSLGNGKIIVALVEDRSTTSSVRFYVVDYQDNCSTYVQFGVDFGVEILQSYKTFDIVPYYESFDVFAKSSLHCKPTDAICMIRYSEDGVHQGIRNFDFDTSETNIDLESVHPLIEFEPSSGYVYASKQKSTLRILDASLKTIKARKTSGYLMTYSVLNGDIGLCTKTYDAEDNVECLKVDSRLKIKSRASMTDVNYFGTRRLYNLHDGSSLLLSLSRGGRLITSLVKRYGVDGKLGVPTLFRYECQSLTTEPQDYFVELKGGVYCFNYACSQGLVTHCTSLPTVDREPSYWT